MQNSYQKPKLKTGEDFGPPKNLPPCVSNNDDSMRYLAAKIMALCPADKKKLITEYTDILWVFNEE